MTNPLLQNIGEQEKALQTILNKVFPVGLEVHTLDGDSRSMRQRMEDFNRSSLADFARTLKREVEGMKMEYESEDFNDGGDEEYRDRRIQIQRRVVSSHNEALSKVLSLLAPITDK